MVILILGSITNWVNLAVALSQNPSQLTSTSSKQIMEIVKRILSSLPTAGIAYAQVSQVRHDICSFRLYLNMDHLWYGYSKL
jgi:hypothetical protein